MKWAGYSARIGYKKYTYLVGKLEGNRPLGWPKSKWGDNIRLAVREIQCEDVEQIQLALD